jgi:hypothetical protein
MKAHGSKIGLATLLALLAACGDSDSTGGTGGGGSDLGGAGEGGASGGGPPAAGGAGGEAQGGNGVGGGEGGAACVDTSELTYGEGPTGEPECLDVPSANAFCGFGSDEAICTFSVECGNSKDLGQCQINCEQGSSSFCNDPAAVACVVDAFCSEDCDALAACPFIL